MKFVSTFKVIHKNRNSKARYVRDVKVGDIVRAELTLRSTTGASNGNYALYFNLFRKVGDDFVPMATASQNELTKGYTTDLTDDYTTFLIEEI